jgi:hypothetical protein
MASYDLASSICAALGNAAGGRVPVPGAVCEEHDQVPPRAARGRSPAHHQEHCRASHTLLAGSHDGVNSSNEGFKPLPDTSPGGPGPLQILLTSSYDAMSFKTWDLNMRVDD